MNVENQVLLQAIALSVIVLDVTVYLLMRIVKRVVPKGKGRWLICEVILLLIVGFVLGTTVPGRSRHIAYLKERVTDLVESERHESNGNLVASWIEDKVTSVAIDVLLNATRVKSYWFVSVGYVETKWGWQPQTVGLCGVVFPSPFIVSKKFEEPNGVSFSQEIRNGKRSLLLVNNGEETFKCEISFGTVVREVTLSHSATVTIGHEGFLKTIANKVKKGMSFVNMPREILANDDLTVTFKTGDTLRKTANLKIRDERVDVSWRDPE